jgi:hypothetical protein
MWGANGLAGSGVRSAARSFLPFLFSIAYIACFPVTMGAVTMAV